MNHDYGSLSFDVIRITRSGKVTAERLRSELGNLFGIFEIFCLIEKELLEFVLNLPEKTV